MSLFRPGKMEFLKDRSHVPAAIPTPTRAQNERLIAETFLPCETTVRVFDLDLGDDDIPIYSVVIDMRGLDRVHSRRISVSGTAALKDLAEMFTEAYKAVRPDSGAPCACGRCF